MQAGQFLYREPLRIRCTVVDAEDLREVGDCVPANGERELSLPFYFALAVSDEQRARVQNGGKCSDPGLIVMLRSEETQERVGQMRFHQLRRPGLPIAKVICETVLDLRPAMPPK